MKLLSSNNHSNRLIWKESKGWANEYSLEEFLDANPLEWMYVDFCFNSEHPDTVTSDMGATRLASVEHVMCLRLEWASKK